jgi:hypothetical protein
MKLLGFLFPITAHVRSACGFRLLSNKTELFAISGNEQIKEKFTYNGICAENHAFGLPTKREVTAFVGRGNLGRNIVDLKTIQLRQLYDLTGVVNSENR